VAAAPESSDIVPEKEKARLKPGRNTLRKSVYQSGTYLVKKKIRSHQATA
jgi:hypothetical protein